MAAVVTFICDVCQKADAYDGVDFDDLPPGWVLVDSPRPGLEEHVCPACQEATE